MRRKPRRWSKTGCEGVPRATSSRRLPGPDVRAARGSVALQVPLVPLQGLALRTCNTERRRGSAAHAGLGSNVSRWGRRAKPSPRARGLRRTSSRMGSAIQRGQADVMVEVSRTASQPRDMNDTPASSGNAPLRSPRSDGSGALSGHPFPITVGCAATGVPRRLLRRDEDDDSVVTGAVPRARAPDGSSGNRGYDGGRRIVSTRHVFAKQGGHRGEARQRIHCSRVPGGVRHSSFSSVIRRGAVVARSGTKVSK